MPKSRKKITRIGRHPAIYLPKHMQNLIGKKVNLEILGDRIIIHLKEEDGYDYLLRQLNGVIDTLSKIRDRLEEILGSTESKSKEVATSLKTE